MMKHIACMYVKLSPRRDRKNVSRIFRDIYRKGLDDAYPPSSATAKSFSAHIAGVNTLQTSISPYCS